MTRRLKKRAIKAIGGHRNTMFHDARSIRNQPWGPPLLDALRARSSMRHLSVEYRLTVYRRLVRAALKAASRHDVRYDMIRLSWVWSVNNFAEPQTERHVVYRLDVRKIPGDWSTKYWHGYLGRFKVEQETV